MIYSWISASSSFSCDDHGGGGGDPAIPPF